MIRQPAPYGPCSDPDISDTKRNIFEEKYSVEYTAIVSNLQLNTDFNSRNDTKSELSRLCISTHFYI